MDKHEPSEEEIKITKEKFPGWDWVSGRGWCFFPDRIKEDGTKLPRGVGKKCNCGVESTFGPGADPKYHSDWCELNDNT